MDGGPVVVGVEVGLVVGVVVGLAVAVGVAAVVGVAVAVAVAAVVGVAAVVAVGVVAVFTRALHPVGARDDGDQMKKRRIVQIHNSETMDAINGFGRTSKRDDHGPWGVGYIRVSTDDQATSPEVQKMQILSWANREKIKIASWHEDIGVSGSTPAEDRPGLLNALNDLRKGDYFLVAKHDRLARDVLVSLTVEHAIKNAGAALVSVDGIGNGDDPSAALLRTIIGAMAQYERALIRARTSQALSFRLKQGIVYEGEILYGFRRDPNDRRFLILDPVEQATCDFVMKLHAKGHDIEEILELLSSHRRFTRNGKPFQFIQVKRIIDQWDTRKELVLAVEGRLQRQG